MTKRLLPIIPDGLCVGHVLPEPDRITIFVRPRHWSVPCPCCHAPSSRVHSLHERRLADLPWQGRPVILRLQARRFLCREVGCPKDARRGVERDHSPDILDVAFGDAIPLEEFAGYRMERRWLFKRLRL